VIERIDSATELDSVHRDYSLHPKGPDLIGTASGRFVAPGAVPAEERSCPFERFPPFPLQLQLKKIRSIGFHRSLIRSPKSMARDRARGARTQSGAVGDASQARSRCPTPTTDVLAVYQPVPASAGASSRRT